MEIPRIASTLLLALALCLVVVTADESSTSNTTTVPPFETQPDNATAQSSGADDADINATASALHTMYINTRKPSLSSPITLAVFSNDELSSAFTNCTLQSPLNSSDCFIDDAYNDRLSFQLTVHDASAKFSESMAARPPEVSSTVDGQTIAGPALMLASLLEDYSNLVNVQDPNSIIVTVKYNCKSNSNGIVPIRLLLHLGEDDKADVTIHWQKVCANGINDKMEYGYLTGAEDIGSALQHSFGTDTAALVTVGASDESTEFFLKLGQPGALQVFLSPYIFSTFSDIVSIHVRGNHPQGGVVEGLKITKFQVGYECHRKGEATIEANIAIPPFQNISAVWKKGML